ncbi:hypothetical protein [Streptomyces sp. NPDC050485]|uniref:hypothetical protein n=1 Tax=Streptomyces sp. NPDC050485 TaxID=3365617 RepID=UPI0037B746F9
MTQSVDANDGFVETDEYAPCSGCWRCHGTQDLLAQVKRSIEEDRVKSYLLDVFDVDTQETVHFVALKCKDSDYENRITELVNAFMAVSGRDVEASVIHEA